MTEICRVFSGSWFQGMSLREYREAARITVPWRGGSWSRTFLTPGLNSGCSHIFS